MFDSKERVRHLPYFTELASLEDTDPSWRAVSAGLVFLRLVDAWIEEGAAVVAADGWGVRSVAAAIEEMPAGLPARAILTSALDVLTNARSGDMHAVAPRLMAYARSLDLDGKLALAADVYETVIAHVHPDEESEIAVNALLRRVPGLAGLPVKESYSHEQPFNRMLVKIKKEIIAFGVEGIAPAKYTLSNQQKILKAMSSHVPKTSSAWATWTRIWTTTPAASPSCSNTAKPSRPKTTPSPTWPSSWKNC